ncbi:MAG: hypothetical protein HY221_01440 [Candidatus Sungbacteria bacterium]|uniref:Uncharacterized protein n=1 Tax=Candidatus Sungiibacteriota bacterium TaxID=2750080 RepID=A0A932QY45_9BACT|nr:hypothetical protein [Candidatus Sungbacteria bacterium]
MRKLIVVSVLSAIAASSVGFGFFVLVGAVIRENKARAMLVPQVENLMHQRVVEKTLGIVITQRKEDVDRVRRFFVDDAQPVDFVTSLEQTAQGTRNGIEIGADEGAKSTAGELLFRVSVEGTRDTVQNFLQAVEAMPYLATVEAADFQMLGPGVPRSRGMLRGPGAVAPSVRLLLDIRVQASQRRL